MEIIKGIAKDQQKYFDSDRLNQSTLKKIDKDGLIGLLDDKGSSRSFAIGSAVDFMITCNHANQNFEDFFVVWDSNITDTELAVFTLLEEKEYSIFNDENLKEVLEEIRWQPNWKPETRVNKFRATSAEKFEKWINSKGKTILSVTDKQLVNEIVSNLLNSNRTKHVFDLKRKGTMYCQVIINFEYEGVPCKAMLDLLYVEVKGSALHLYPYDIKTTAKSTLEFPKSYADFRYDLQAMFYIQALKTHSEILLKDEYKNCTHCKVHPFQFIVESTTKPGNPLVYEVPIAMLEGEHVMGDFFKKSNKNLQELMEEYKYYLETDFREDFRLRNVKNDEPIWL